jgi:hypothetical protein
MYTKIIRKILRKIDTIKSGHCDGDGGGNGHCR